MPDFSSCNQHCWEASDVNSSRGSQPLDCTLWSYCDDSMGCELGSSEKGASARKLSAGECQLLNVSALDLSFAGTPRDSLVQSPYTSKNAASGAPPLTDSNSACVFCKTSRVVIEETASGEGVASLSVPHACMLGVQAS